MGCLFSSSTQIKHVYCGYGCCCTEDKQEDDGVHKNNNDNNAGGVETTGLETTCKQIVITVHNGPPAFQTMFTTLLPVLLPVVPAQEKPQPEVIQTTDGHQIEKGLKISSDYF